MLNSKFLKINFILFTKRFTYKLFVYPILFSIVSHIYPALFYNYLPVQNNFNLNQIYTFKQNLKELNCKPRLYNLNYIFSLNSKNHNELGTLKYYVCPNCKNKTIYNILLCRTCFNSYFFFKKNIYVLSVDINPIIISELNNNTPILNSTVFLTILYYFSQTFVNFLKKTTSLKYISQMFTLKYFIFFDAILSSLFIFILALFLIIMNFYFDKLRLKYFFKNKLDFIKIINYKYVFSIKVYLFLFLYILIFYTICVYLYIKFENFSFIINVLFSFIFYKLNDYFLNFLIFSSFKNFYLIYRPNIYSFFTLNFSKNIPFSLKYLQIIKENDFILENSQQKLVIIEYVYNTEIFFIICFILYIFYISNILTNTNYEI